MKTMMKTLLACVCMWAMGMMCLGGLHGQPSAVVSPSTGVLCDHDSSGPALADCGFVLSAPAQSPVLLPTNGSRLLTTAKYRTAAQRTIAQRRPLCRPLVAALAPLSMPRHYCMLRSTLPLRSRPAVAFYVIQLCRLLC